MKKTLLLMLLLVAVSCAVAQNTDRPGWTYNTPTAGNNTYMYTVERASGITESEARNNAVAQVYRSTMMRIGAVVSWDEINNSLQNGDDWGKVSMKYNIPVNKVCEYIEKRDDGYIVFVLCQVAKSGSSYPDWDDFSGCSDVKTYSNGGALLKSAIIPGWGQMSKNRIGSGVFTLLGEVILVGTGVVPYYLANQYVDEIRTARSLWDAQGYKKEYDVCRTINIAAYSAAAALYVWNLYRAWSMTPRYKKDKHSLSFHPAIIPTEKELSAGIGLTFNF